MVSVPAPVLMSLPGYPSPVVCTPFMTVSDPFVSIRASHDEKAGLYEATYVPRQPGAYRAKVVVAGPDGAEVGNREAGSQSFDQHLTELFTKQIIDVSEAKRLATNVDALNLALRGITNSDTKLR